MITTTTIRAVLSLIVCALILMPRAAFAQEPSRPSAETIMAKVAEARTLLRSARIGTDRIGGDNAVLAIWDMTPGGPVRLVHVRGGTSRTRGVEVSLRQRNGVNSRYEVLSPAGYAVIGIRTNVRDQARRHRSRPATYVPYGPELHTPEIERLGRDYLTTLIDRAGDRLDRRGVDSLTDPDRRVTEMISARILLAILVIEHIDPDEFRARGVAHTTGKVFATVALNRGDAYRYAVSYAGAGGLAQFIRPTYSVTRRRYARAGLPADFVQAMSDHEHAVSAQYCLADWSFGRLPAATRRSLAARDREEDLGAFIAAAYNGGEDRAAAAMAAHPLAWENEGNGLARQTVGYVREFRAVYRHLFP